MVFLFLTPNYIIASFATIAIIIVVGLVILLHRYYIESHKDNIKTRMIVIVYIFLFIMLAVAIVGILALWGYDISDYLLATFDSIVGTLEASIVRIVGTLIVLFISILVYKIIKVSLYRLGLKPSTNQRRKKTIAKISMSITKYIMVIFGILIVLSVWGINVTPALAGLGIMGIVIGLGAQKFINDLISGFFIVFEHHFDVGDWVEINGFMGEVIDIGLKTTKLQNFKGEVKIFNNGSIDPVSNFSRADSMAIVDFGIAYSEDIAKTIEILKQELPLLRKEHENMLEDPRVLGVTNLADSSVNLRVVVKVVSMTHWGTERAIRLRVKEILNAHNIEIPFPQVVIHQAKSK